MKRTHFLPLGFGLFSVEAWRLLTLLVYFHGLLIIIPSCFAKYCFNPLMLTAAKLSLVGKIFEGEMLIRTLPTNLY